MVLSVWGVRSYLSSFLVGKVPLPVYDQMNWTWSGWKNPNVACSRYPDNVGIGKVTRGWEPPHAWLIWRRGLWQDVYEEWIPKENIILGGGGGWGSTTHCLTQINPLNHKRNATSNVWLSTYHFPGRKLTHPANQKFSWENLLKG